MSKTQNPKSEVKTQNFNATANDEMKAWTSDFGLYHETHGAGAALVLIPGFASGAWTWFRQTGELSENFRVVTFDPRGVGKSKANARHLQNLSMETFVEDVLGLLDYLKIKKAHVLGASFGGFVALKFALSFPDRLNKLILACTSFGGKNHIAPDVEILRSFTPDAALPLREKIRQSIRPAFTKEFNENHADQIERICQLREENPVADAVYLAQLQTALTFDTEQRLGAIENETLVITGDKDAVVPMQNSLNLARKIPNASLEIIENGSHLFFIENADEFNRAVKKFLE